jgi:hypothetical protein
MRRIRRLLVVAATAAVGLLLITPTAAQAQPVPERYAVVDRGGIGQYGQVDIDGVVLTICAKCYWYYQFIVDQPDPQIVNQIDQSIFYGLQDLGFAASSSLPAVQSRYRTAALNAFARAASLAGRGGLRVGQVGIVDAGRGVLNPEPSPWLAAAAQDIADGIGVLVESPTLPLPPPRAALAMAQFDEAYAEMSAKAPIGD